MSDNGFTFSEEHKLGHRLAIFTAVEDWDKAEEALAQGADASVKKSQALVDAARAGKNHIVKKCLQNGADPNAQDACALRVAATHGHLKVVKTLIEAGADIHTWDDATLRRAVEKDQARVVDYLLAQGANIDTRDGYVFETASRFSHKATVGVLEKWRKHKTHEQTEGRRQQHALRRVRKPGFGPGLR